MRFHLSIVTLAGSVSAQVPAWGRCGGRGYTGSTICTGGYSCVFLNDWYSQCQPGAPAPPSTSTSTPAPTCGSGHGAIRYLGRVNPAAKALTWPGTGVSFTFTGTSATIGLASVQGANSVDLFIDGGEPIVISNVADTSISTPAGLTKSSHDVVLRKRSEAILGSITIGSVSTDGTLNAKAGKKRQIEVIGDSITVGYGLDGTYPCTNNASVEDNPKTYEALAAKALNADYHVIAWSGKGLIRNYLTASPGSPVMPELYTRYGAMDPDNSYPFPASWTPQAVVINLGTNDFGYIFVNSSGQPYKVREPIDVSAFTAAMVEFVQSIQSHYPNAEFFIMTSPMLSDSYPTPTDAQHTTQANAIKAAIAQIGDKAHFVDWPTQGSDVGCDYHPNAATHAAEGDILAATIGDVLGW